jgi:protease I
MANELRGRRIAFMIANEGVEQVELTQPWQAVKDADGTPERLAPESGRAQAFNHLDKADTFGVDSAIDDADPADYDALVLPGGVANPDQLRMVPAAVDFVRSMFEAGKPAAVICHGPWTLVEADLVRGRTLTSWPSLQTDIRNAGGTWIDTEVQVCTAGPNVLVTSHKPDDLAAFCK